MAKPTVYYATGRRKTSAARVFLRPGTGKVEINGRPSGEYITTVGGRNAVEQPFVVTETRGQFDAQVTVVGGGINSQAEAIRHGMARALLVVDSDKFRGNLKKAGLLTRDARIVERKKYGRHKARKSVQYSKR